MTNFCQHRNEHSGFLKCKEFLRNPSHCHSFNKVCAHKVLRYRISPTQKLALIVICIHFAPSVTKSKCYKTCIVKKITSRSLLLQWFRVTYYGQLFLPLLMFNEWSILVIVSSVFSETVNTLQTPFQGKNNINFLQYILRFLWLCCRNIVDTKADHYITKLN